MSTITYLWVRLVALFVVIAVIVFGGLSIRKAYVERDQFKRQYEEQKAAAEDYQTRVLEANRLAQARAESAERIRTVTKEVLREVPIRIPADACPLPADWRVLNDAAAEGTDPAPAR